MGGGIVVRPGARTVMRALRPAVWPVLLDVALDAEWRDGRLVAATSARLVAEHLRIAPGTAAAGLRALRQHGLVELAQSSGTDGRFGLAIYTLHLPDGVELCEPHAEMPHTDGPHTDGPHTDRPHSDELHLRSDRPTDGSLVFSCPWDGDLGSPQQEWAEPAQPGPATTRESDAATTEAPATATHASSTALRLEAELRHPDARFEPGVVAGPRRPRRRSSRMDEQGALDLGTDA